MDQAPRGRGLPAAVGRYEILARLAAGGMAEILLGRLTGPQGFERAVVIKRILPHLAQDPDFIRMFLDEARLVAGIRHPNVVQVQDLVVQDDDVFLVMEYLEGESAASLLRRMGVEGEWLSSALVAHIAAEVCAGLHAAHELTDGQGRPQNVVHRDISPANIFITYEGTVKVVDFGIAKAADRTVRTEAGMVKGKFAYMSPEQAQAIEIDRRSDIYSLGIVIYELGTGRNPFMRATDAATLKAALEEPLVPPSRIVASFAEALESVCLKALERDREARYATAAEMRHDLVGVMRSLGGESAPGETLAQLMARLFPDRIAHKRELLQGLRSGATAAELPQGAPSGSGAGVAATSHGPATATPTVATTDRRVVAERAKGRARPIAIALAVVAAAGIAMALTRGANHARVGSNAAVDRCGQRRVSITDVHAEWTTPNTIQWRWALEAQGRDLIGLELVVGTDEAEVAMRARDSGSKVPNTTVWTGRERPELQYFEWPRTSKVERVDGTLTDGHVPDSVYHARLVALDASGCRVVSDDVATRTTPVPYKALVLLRDRLPPGAVMRPATPPLIDGKAPRMEFTFRCPRDQPFCHNNLTVENVDANVGTLAPGPFAQGYLEVTFACIGSGIAFWSHLNACFGENCDALCEDRCDTVCLSRCSDTHRWVFQPLAVTCGDGTPRRVQVPLRVFQADVASKCSATSAKPVRSACLLARENMGQRFYGLWLGGTWPNGATVRIDEAVIHW